MASLCFNQGDLGRVSAALARARPLVRAAGGVEESARLDELAARVEHAVGNVEAARDLFARAIGVFERLTMCVAICHTFTGMARVALEAGDAGLAERLLDDAAAKLPAAGPWFRSRVLYVRALLAVQRGDPEQAIALVHQSSRSTNSSTTSTGSPTPWSRSPARRSSPARTNGRRACWGARCHQRAHGGEDRAQSRPRPPGTGGTRGARAPRSRDRWNQAYAAGRVASIESLLEDVERRI
jgi:hypothetical protein